MGVVAVHTFVYQDPAEVQFHLYPVKFSPDHNLLIYLQNSGLWSIEQEGASDHDASNIFGTLLNDGLTFEANSMMAYNGNTDVLLFQEKFDILAATGVTQLEYVQPDYRLERISMSTTSVVHAEDNGAKFIYLDKHVPWNYDSLNAGEINYDLTTLVNSDFFIDVSSCGEYIYDIIFIEDGNVNDIQNSSAIKSVRITPPDPDA